MPRTVTLTFADGSKHVYENVPDDVTPAAVQERAGRDFPSLRLTNIDGGRRAVIPGQEGEAARVAALQAAPGPSIGDRIGGALETAATLVTGATGGTLGMVGGTLGGVVGGAVYPNGEDPQAANRLLEQAAVQGASALTYAPRTAEGQRQTQAVGEFLRETIPLIGVAPQLSAMTAVRPAGPAGVLARASVPESVGQAGGAVVAGVQQAAQALRPQRAAGVPAAAAAAPVETQAATLAEAARRAGQGGMGSSSAVETLARGAAPSEETLASARRLGVDAYLQPDHVTTNEAYRQVVAAIKSNPQSKVALAEREGLANVAKRASDLVDEIGGTSDLSALSSEVRTNLERVRAKMEGQAEALYKQVDDAIPKTLRVDAPDTLGFLQSEARNLGGVDRLRPVERRLFATLSANEDGTTPVTYAFLDRTRKEIGQALQKASGPFKDSESGLLKKLYSTLSGDQERIAQQQGAYYTFQAAKYATRLQKGVEDDLAALFGKELDRSFVASGDAGLPGAFAGLAKGDSARLGRLLAAVPADLRQRVVASGLTTVFRNAASRGEFDFTRYAKWYGSLRDNRQAYAAVMSNLPLEARKQLEALYRVSSGVSESLNRRIKTGALNTIKAEMIGGDTLMENLYGVAKRSAAGVAAEAVTTPMGVPGAGLSAGIASALTKGKPRSIQAVDELIASPEFERLVRLQAEKAVQEQLAAKTPPVQLQKAVRQFAQSPRFSSYVRAIGYPEELKDREAWVLQALQPAQAAQQQNNPRTLH